MIDRRASRLAGGSRSAAFVRVAASVVLIPVVLFIALVSVNTTLGYGAPVMAIPALYAAWVAGVDVLALVRDRDIPARPSYRWFLASVGVLALWGFYLFRGFELLGLDI